jgi:hypothetical protein
MACRPWLALTRGCAPPVPHLPLAIGASSSDNCGQMSGISSVLRTSASDDEFRIVEIMMRFLASSLVRLLTRAAGGSKRVHSRYQEAEFPAASQNACRLLEGPLRGSRGAGCASIDALRLFNNSVNLKDQNEISSIRERSAPFAGRIPTKGRSRPALSRKTRASSQEENVLATPGSFSWRQRADDKEACACIT